MSKLLKKAIFVSLFATAGAGAGGLLPTNSSASNDDPDSYRDDRTAEVVSDNRRQWNMAVGGAAGAGCAVVALGVAGLRRASERASDPPDSLTPGG